MRLPTLQSNRGATLVEAMIGFGVGMMAIIFFLSLFLSGARIMQFQALRYKAVTQAMTITTKINLEMRGAFTNCVGDLTNQTVPSFKSATNATPSGNSMMIYLDTTMTNWVCYYYLPASNALYRCDELGATALMASPITNSAVIFSALPNNNAAMLTTVNLQFFTTNQQTKAMFHNFTNILTFKTIVTARKI